MGVTYRRIDEYLLGGTAAEQDRITIEKCHSAAAHKRRMPISYSAELPML